MTTTLGADVRRDALTRGAGRLTAWVGIAAVVLSVVAPVAVIAASILDPTPSLWAELWRTRLPGMIVDTLTLLLAVVAGAVVLGTSLAWLVTAHDFPGRRLIGWLLVVPLTVPGYVAGFVWLDTASAVIGPRGARSIWLCAAVLVLTLYPYVYLLARAAFRAQGADMRDSARVLGLGPVAACVRVALPAARPAIAAGGALVTMEVLTDVGTVRLFNVSTVADGVLRVWFGTGSRQGAAELATTLVATAIALVVVERILRRGARYSRRASARPMTPVRLSGVRALAATAAAVVVVAVAAGVPLARLGAWGVEAQRAGATATVAGGVWHHLGATLAVAGLAVTVCVAVGSALVLFARRHGVVGRVMVRASALGYAMPGPVVAVGAVIVLAALDRTGLVPGSVVLVGSLLGLVFALAVRFLAVAVNGVDSGLDQMPASAVASARTLGARGMRVAWSVELPSVRPALVAAAALVIIDVVKELPITLLLRPFGFDTLAVWVWQATSESLWAQAAVPSLAMIAVGSAAVGALLVALERGAEVVS
ncbi:MAG: ABC transporter permease [Actinomycetota bacterium]